MFTENFKSNALELSRIKNLSEFGLNLDECQVLFSKDLKYGVIYTEMNIAIVDMNEKCLFAKFSNEKNSKISKLKITQRNNITYINRSSEWTKLVISSIDFIGYFFEIKIPNDTLDYLYIEGQDDQDEEDFIFTINSRGDLEFISLKQTIEKKRVNILKDSHNKLKSNFEVNFMEFIQETNNLIILLTNGTILNYTVSLDPETEISLNQKTINYEEIKHLENFEEINKIISKNNNIYEISSFKITKFIFSQNEYDDINNIEMNDENNNKISIFLIIGFTKNKNDSYLSFYEIQSNQLLFLNRIELRNKIILDSFIYQTKNNLLNYSVPDYFLLICKDIGQSKIEILASDLLQCFVKKNMNILNENVNQDQNGKEIFSLINEVEENYVNVRKIGIMGVYVINNPDFTLRNLANNLENEDDLVSVAASNLNDYKYMNYSLEIIIRKLVNYSNFDAFIVDSDVEQKTFQPSKKFQRGINLENFDDEIMRFTLTHDVNRHLNILEQNSINSNQINLNFRRKVINLIEQDSIYKNFSNFSNLNENNSEVDFYLLFLIYTNEILSIKYYLSLRENISNKQFLITNEKLFNTAYNIFYYFIKNLILNNLNSHTLDYIFLSNDKLLNNLQTIFDVIKISKSRLENPYDNPFIKENEILLENSNVINSVLFEIENVILMNKVIRSFVLNIIKNESEDKLGNIFTILNKNMKIKRENRKKLNQHNNTSSYIYFELIMMNNFDEIYPSWRKLYIQLLNNFTIKKEEISKLFLVNENEFIFEDLVYFTKMQIFFQYLYFIIEYKLNENKIKDEFAFQKAIFDEKLFKEYFSEMENEFKEYFQICLNFYKLDLNSVIRNNNNNQLKIDVTKLSNFLIRFNTSKLTKSNYFKEYINYSKINFNSAFISLLKQDSYNKEAIVLSKNILNLLNEFEDFKTQLHLLLDMGLINIAYQFVNNSFACLVCYSEENESNTINKNLLESIVNSEEFKKMKDLYFILFEYLIKNNQISLIFTLPLNFIERYLLKEFLISRKEYEDLLLLYFIKIKKIKDSEDINSDYQKSSQNSNEMKIIYRNVIDTLKFIFAEENFGILKNLNNSVFINKNESNLLNLNVNVEIEKDLAENLKKFSNFDVKNLNELAVKILEDSYADAYNMQFKPMNASFMNDTIKTLISKKQETAKKNFGLFTEIKPARKLDFDFMSERNYDNSSKMKSYISRSNLQNRNVGTHTPVRENVKSLIFSSDINIFKK